MLELNHDASSALSAALIDAEYLTTLKGEGQEDQLREVTSELAVSLSRLKQLIDEIRGVGQSLAEPERVAIGGADDPPADG